MKNLFVFLKAFQPLYVIVTSLVGFALILLILVWTFPVPGDDVGDRFSSNIFFTVWVLEFGSLSAFLTVVFLPLWREFIELFRKQIMERNGADNTKLRLMIIFGFITFILSWLIFVQLTALNGVGTGTSWPPHLSMRLVVIYAYIFIVLAPIPLTNLLVHDAISRKMEEITSINQNSKKLFEIAHDLLKYRDLLQNGLLNMGIIASAIPITAATLRSIMITLDSANEEAFPLIGVIAYGLGFSAILILFYASSHFILAQAARLLQDKLCPINNFTDLEKNLKRRAELDQWLHINTSLADNLKTGIFALAPLATSFIATILGINL